jgi:hypothetical protein
MVLHGYFRVFQIIPIYLEPRTRHFSHKVAFKCLYQCYGVICLATACYGSFLFFQRHFWNSTWNALFRVCHHIGQRFWPISPRPSCGQGMSRVVQVN